MAPLLKHNVPEMDSILWVSELSEAMRSCPFSNRTDTVLTARERGRVGTKRGPVEGREKGDRTVTARAL